MSQCIRTHGAQFQVGAALCGPERAPPRAAPRLQQPVSELMAGRYQAQALGSPERPDYGQIDLYEKSRTLP